MSAGYFDSPDTLATEVAKHDGRANLYVTLNPVDPDLLARAQNHIKDRLRDTTADENVPHLHWLFIDVDPIRPSGISSTETEREAAYEVLTAAVSALESLEWPEPLTAMSGNGYYALYRLDLPNDPASKALLKAVLGTLSARFSNSSAHIDTGVFNPARICGIVGSLKMKGDSTDERPHRRSHILSAPEELRAVTEAQLAALAEIQEPAPVRAQQSGRAPLLTNLLDAAGIQYREQPPDANGVTWYHVQRCPFHADGKDFECGVGQKLPAGAYAGHGFHPECADKGWQEWKVALGLPIAHHPRPDQPPSNEANGSEEDIGITRRLADAITAVDHFAVDPGLRLYWYSNGAYHGDGEQHIAARTKALCNEWQISKKWSRYRVKEVTAYIATDAPSLWENPPLNRLNVANGVVNLDTLELLPHSPGFLSTVQLPVRFDPAATCPAWEKQIKDTVPSDTHDLIWEVLAWLLTSDSSIQRAVLFIGDGSNGKSTLLRAVRAFLGPSNTVALSLHKIESDRFASANLLGKLANICPDLPSEHLAGTSAFKAITGGDDLQAEYKYQAPFRFKPVCKLVFSANHPPRSADASYAFFRRWLVVPFEMTFEATDKIPSEVLDSRLAQERELSGVLNRALTALPELRRRGDFLETASTRAAWEEFRETTDPLAVWLDRNTISSSTAVIVRDELHRAYGGHCFKAGIPPMSGKSFMAAVRRLRPSITEGKRSINDQRQWCFLGIGLVADAGADTAGRAGRTVPHVHDVHHFSTCSENEDREEREGREEEEKGIREIVDMVDNRDVEDAWQEAVT